MIGCILFLIFGLSLIFTRVLFRDETWLYGISLGYIQQGIFIDLAGMRDGIYEVNFSGIFYYLVLTLWIKLVGNNLILLRLLSIIFGFISVLFGGKFLKKINPETYIWVLLLVISNYYFLYAYSQLRYEAVCLSLILISLYLLIVRPFKKEIWPIAIATTLLIASIFTHLQAAFISGPLLLYTFIRLIEKREYLSLTALLLIPSAILILYVFYILDHKDWFLKWYELRFGENANMAGHEGGMFNAVKRYIENKELVKIAVAFILFFAHIYILILAYIKTKTKDQNFFYLFIAGSGALLSWMLTTNILNDYHSVWLIFVLINLVFVLKSDNFKLFSFKYLSIPVILSLIGLVYMVNTVLNNELAKYHSDVNRITELVKENDTFIESKNRRILLDYNFNRDLFDIKNKKDKKKIVVIIQKQVYDKQKDTSVVKGQTFYWKLIENSDYSE